MTAIRRRGDALRDAVLAATLAEIAEFGLRGASMDRIAKRAGTGKASLYRRWPNVRALTLDAFLSTLEAGVPSARPDTGTLRGDLLTGMLEFIEALDGPLGLVVRELISEAVHDASLVVEFQERLGVEQRAAMVAALQRGMARGEIPAGPIDPFVLELPAAMVVYHLVMSNGLPDPGQCEHIIDRLVMPLLNSVDVA